jgi:hypothetical protein
LDIAERNGAFQFHAVGWCCLPYLAWYPSLARRWKEFTRSPEGAGQFPARHRRGFVQPKDDRLFHGVFAAIRRSGITGGASAGGYVQRFRNFGGDHGLLLGGSVWTWSRVVHEAGARKAAWPSVRRRINRWWDLAIARSATDVIRR